MTETVSFGRRLTMLASQHRRENAVIFAARDNTQHAISWDDLERRANQTARLLAGRGATAGDLVIVGLKNSLEHLYCTFGAWKLGASVLPLRADLPEWERERLLDLAKA